MLATPLVKLKNIVYSNISYYFVYVITAILTSDGAVAPTFSSRRYANGDGQSPAVGDR
ncbi:MAG: hypothetical protein AAF316_04400 [Cyanobacteria bacterium P01_A01_bin.80]